MPTGEKLRIALDDGTEVSGLLLKPVGARYLLVLAHGAGAGMTHPFFERLARELADVGVATLRYQFPYLEQRRRVPDKPDVLTATVAAAVRTAWESAPELPLLAGGKSMGGRVTSQAASQGLLTGVQGLVFFGFPLHPPNRPSTNRAEHLAKVPQPMLFLQGTRDTLADLTLLRPICVALGARATLHVIETADHSFHVLKSSGKTDANVFRELAQTTATWAEKLRSQPSRMRQGRAFPKTRSEGKTVRMPSPRPVTPERQAPMGTAPKPSSQTQKPSTGDYHTIAPYLIVRRAADFIEFLKVAFGATERFRFPREEGSELLMHAEVILGDSVIELADAYDKILPAPQAIHLYMENADATYERALEAGAKSIYPVADQHWGDRQGAVRDTFGNIWYIATAKDWTPEPGGLRTVQPYLHLKGADQMISFLRKAFGAEVLGHVPKSPEGHVLHATIRIGDNTLELDEAHDEFRPMPCHMHLHIEDADATYAQAIKASAISLDPPSNKPYGRSCGVQDVFGNSWYMTSPLEAA